MILYFYDTGMQNKLVTYQEIKLGVHILDKLHIDLSINGNPVTLKGNLDSCSVVVFPSLNPDHEEIQIDGDESLSSTMDIRTNINKDGVEMIGTDSTRNYLSVLHALVYSNKKPAYYLNRVFKLSCSKLSSQFKSSEYTLTLTVLHPKQSFKTTNSPSSTLLSSLSSSTEGNDLSGMYQKDREISGSAEQAQGTFPSFMGRNTNLTIIYNFLQVQKSSRILSYIQMMSKSQNLMFIL